MKVFLLKLAVRPVCGESKCFPLGRNLFNECFISRSPSRIDDGDVDIFAGLNDHLVFLLDNV